MWNCDIADGAYTCSWVLFPLKASTLVLDLAESSSLLLLSFVAGCTVWQEVSNRWQHQPTRWASAQLWTIELLLLNMFCLHISEKNIKSFMAYYWATFPLATVLPKMHILEDHIVPWIRRRQVGFGFMGEQGAESIHAYFNSLKS